MAFELIETEQTCLNSSQTFFGCLSNLYYLKIELDLLVSQLYHDVYPAMHVYIYIMFNCIEFPADIVIISIYS